MRRVLFTMLLAFALGAGGVANAAATLACPMQTGASAAHDCCDENGAPAQQDDNKMAGCFVGMACRTAPALTSVPAPIAAPLAALPAGYIELSQLAPASGPLQDLFRPPRTI
jgi:hypothetical protein